jgi:hypothetical protein
MVPDLLVVVVGCRQDWVADVRGGRWLKVKALA